MDCYHTLESSPVRNVTPMSPDDSTLVLSWLPPSEPGDVTSNYTVRIVLYSSGTTISQESTMTTSYTATKLSETVFLMY